MLDNLKEACGIFGIYGHPAAAELTYLGLYALQHRGEESAGIVSADGEMMYQHKALGLVTDVFSDHKVIERLKGHIAIGHNRYSTTGSTSLINAQPLLMFCKDRELAIGHNGNLVNTVNLRQKMQEEGAIFQTTVDSEIILHLIARSPYDDLIDRIVDALRQAQGAYSLLLASKDKIVAVRDPLGFRPLCLGKLDDSYVVTSETCAFDIVGAEYLRDVEPGEMLVLDKHGITSLKPFPPARHSFCIFEYIYFSRPDSRISGDYVDKTRRKLGKQLAIEQPADADIVISVPDSSNTAALGYSQESGMRFEIGLIRNHYVGRTFIHPSQEVRNSKVRIKYNPVGGVLKGKRVVVVEDSIVRGTTQRQVAKMIRLSGAQEVHVRVSCPPIRFPCFYGIDFPTRKELIATSHTIEEIRKHIRVESLGYLSLEGMLKAAEDYAGGFCTACYSGRYPLPLQEELDKFALEKQTVLKI